jgi:RNA-directed DNA polymerase
MNLWAPHLYRQEAIRRGIPDEIVELALHQAHKLQNAGLPAILSLGHLAFHTNVDYSFLRNTVCRRFDPYRAFQIRKRDGGARYINVPHTNLLQVQKWIDRFILSNIPASPYSYAYCKGQSIVECAKQHLGCIWLIKVDLRHFFESLSEIQAYRVFSEIGYGNLISFEIARLCSKVLKHNSRKYQKPNWLSNAPSPIDDYNDERIGHLPQGAPTSPKLANLIVRKLDFEIAEVCERLRLTFTRYADDIVLSTGARDFTRNIGLEAIRTIYALLPKYGLRPNPQKAQIIPPGARKIVLGLLVDGNKVRLSKTFKRALECHLFFAAKDPVGHTTRRGFSSVLGLKNYITGLLAYANQIDPEYVEKQLILNGIPKWPA